MKLKEYIKKLQKVAETHPNVTVIYSKDDEGNEFSELNYSPSLGNFWDDSFLSDDGTEEFKNEYEINAVCLN
jgi:hypothetical protein